MVLRVHRSHPFKLDFNKEGNLTRSFLPHGTAATTRGEDGIRRFIVWNGHQLHGDVGERLGKKRKMDSKDWKALMNIHHPNAPVDTHRLHKDQQ